MREAFQFLHRTAQVVLLDGFEQVVDAVHPESLQRILVVGRGKDHRTGDLGPLEYREGRTVGQVYIHEYQSGSLVLREPLHRVGDAFQLSDHLHMGKSLPQQRGEVYGGCRFVLYDNYSHTIAFYSAAGPRGSRTVKLFPSSTTLMSRSVSNL